MPHLQIVYLEEIKTGQQLTGKHYRHRFPGTGQLDRLGAARWCLLADRRLDGCDVTLIPQKTISLTSDSLYFYPLIIPKSLIYYVLVASYIYQQFCCGSISGDEWPFQGSW